MGATAGKGNGASEFLGAVLIVLIVWPLINALAAANDMRSTWDGVYSNGQASRGEAIYRSRCAKCHGDGGAGGDAPALSDSGFASNWDSLTLGQLADRTRVSMPLDAPQTLTRVETAEIIAYLLRQNRFPAGEKDLSERSEVQATIEYKAAKP